MSEPMDEKFQKWWADETEIEQDTELVDVAHIAWHACAAQHAVELAATQAAALGMAAKALQSEVSASAHRRTILALITPDSATALTRALDEARREAYKQAALECFKRERWENNGTMPWNAATNGERERNGHEIADAIRALIPGAPQSTQHESIEATEEEFDIWLSLKTRVFELERELAARDARALTRALDEARREGLQQAIWIAGGTPFRCHADDDVNFHSGCVQTRDRIIAAIRHYIALPLTPSAPEAAREEGGK